MNNKFFIFSFLSIVFLASGVMAQDFVVTDNSDNVLLRLVGSSGLGNFTGDIAENGVLLSETYCALTGGCTFDSGNITVGTGYYFVGDGSFLTGITVEDNSINIAGENITSGTIDFARLPDLTNTHTHDWANITNQPNIVSSINDIVNDEGNINITAGSGIVVTTDAGNNQIIINATSSSVDLSDYALNNQSNNLVGDQNISNGNIRLSDTYKLYGESGASMTFEADGGITFKLGA